MKIIVISDTHFCPENFLKAISRESGYDAVIFLGDGYTGIEGYVRSCKIPVYCVCGNCDRGSCMPDDDGEFSAGGKKIFFCHGDRYRVKYGTDIILDEGIRRGAAVILYGHTHTYSEEYRNGIYILNPGAASGYGASYAILEIRPNGILFSRAFI